MAGKYELRRLIGAGAMGAVYEGVHLELGKRLAIKLVHPEFCGSAEVVARFRREARTASAIESEHVAQIFDFGSDDELGFYMIIEYVDGEDLQARLARERWIEAREAACIGWQAARGLSRAHAVGVIHRDLKPANVFLTRRDDGSLLAKILDFGISKVDQAKWRGGAEQDEGDVGPLTEFGTTLGTPQYMSPEQCQGKTELDGRADVWSLCAVLYEMLAGEPAFPDRAGLVGLMQHIVSRDVQPLASRAPWVPEGIARVVDAGLVRDRDARIASADALAARLLEACPEAAAVRSLPEVAHRTDPSELSPWHGLEPARGDDPPPSSADDHVEMFVRSGDIPVPVARRPPPKT
ncbi:MAG TPA: serine/threonine-protein kinase [Polyangiaceae bacterium]|nr:serine/threonine-protein kinase [Polyangiaceae bacterium]